jgi:hypothetical protein
MGCLRVSVTVPLTVSADAVREISIKNPNKIFFICPMFLKSDAKVLLFEQMVYEKTDIVPFGSFFRQKR